MAKQEVTPIIIRRKRVAAHGPHGGAWKVAYADFVTAMMALFIVLWLLSSSENVKKAVAGYFRDPTGPGTAIGSGQAGSGEAMSLEQQDMEHLKDKLQAAFKQMPDFQRLVQDRIQMVVTGEGLRIEFMETEQGFFFPSGSATPTQEGNELLASVAREVGQMPNAVLIEGHTDSKLYSGTSGYGNWELSADRANAARRAMAKMGLAPKQVAQVRGYADQRLKVPDDPFDPSNRRISIVVRYNNVPEQASPAPTAAAATPGGHSGQHPAEPKGEHK